jgi:hypothetical protein
MALALFAEIHVDESRISSSGADSLGDPGTAGGCGSRARQRRPGAVVVDGEVRRIVLYLAQAEPTRRSNVASVIITVLRRWVQTLRDGPLAPPNPLIMVGLVSSSLFLEVMLRAVGI